MTMEKTLYKAAINGDISFLNETLSREINNGTNHHFLSLATTIQHNNIIHIAVQHGRFDFLKEVLRSCFSLLHQTNSNGDTPLHIAAMGGNLSIVSLLVESYQGFSMSLESENEMTAVELESESESEKPPWKVKNLEGNTPLHLALIHGKVWVASYLVELCPEVSSFVNNCSETPLHIAIKYSVDGDKELVIKTIQLINTQRVGLTYKGCPIGDDSLFIIQLLLQKNSSAACLCDANQMTPLLRAALKSNLRAIRAIINECPESVEMNDCNGGTVLHHFRSRSYEEAKELLNIAEIQALKDQQDHYGNTPAYVAVKNCDVEMVRALLECSANLTIKNKEGVSAALLIHEQTNFIGSKIIEIVETEELFVKGTMGMMPEELIASAVEGDVNFLRQKLFIKETDYLLSRTSCGRNIVHLACQSHCAEGLANSTNQILFINEALASLPVLICQTDCRGYTPLHIVIQRCKIDEAFLEMCKRYFQKAKEEVARCNEELYCPPWRVKNVDGNTPLHIALRAGYIGNARKLIEFDNEVAQDVNNDNENILHSLCYSGGFLDSSSCSNQDIDFIIEANISAVDVRDSKGLTPLLKAASSGCMQLAERILKHNPQLMMQCDPNGGTILHRMAYGRPDNKDTARKLLKLLAPLWHIKDDDGNTPSHLTIEKGNFDVAKHFMEGGFALSVRNKKGIMTGDLLGSVDDIPRKFQQFLWKRVEVANQIFGFRTMCGIPTREIKDFISTMSLTAALLATITFTAAFTVPGGFNSQDGTPVLARKAAYCVFLVSDIAAMCLSMMVLFCLLWIMTGEREERVVLVDFSLFLLQTSFYATLLTFMTGVYVTTMPMLPWLAILPFVACSLLILLMHKRIIMGLIPCYRVIYSLYQLASHLVRESICYLRYQIPRMLAKMPLCHPTSRSDEERSSPKFFQMFRP